MSTSAERARAYHAATRHSPQSVAASRHRLDWSNRPAPAKRYRGVEVVALPADLPDSAVRAAEALSGPAARQPARLDLAGVARLLFFSYGVTRRWRRGGLEIPFRAAGSAGALYPVEAYVVCGDLDGLPAGAYHFDAVRYRLQRLRAGDFRAALADAAADSDLARAPLTVALTGVPWRTTWKYQARGWRHLFWDAGVVTAHLLALAEGAGQPARVVAGFADDPVARLLGVTDDQAPAQGGEAPLALVPVGTADSPAPPAAPADPLHLDVEPLSRYAVEEPALWEAHRAGDLADADAVRAWRDSLADVIGEDAAQDVAPPALDDEPLEAVVLRRGSTRAFARGPVPAEAMKWPLAVAARPAPGDLAPPGRSLLVHFVAVHAVAGTAPGAYRWTREGLVRLRAGAARDATAFLCLGQPLGGDAAYTTFHSAELEPLLGAAGARGYRAAQLEAGVASGRLQLAAFAARAGATGLTFFDAEVARFFQTSAEPMLCTAVGVPAYRARPGRRPGEAAGT